MAMFSFNPLAINPHDVPTDRCVTFPARHTKSDIAAGDDERRGSRRHQVRLGVAERGTAKSEDP